MSDQNIENNLKTTEEVETDVVETTTEELSKEALEKAFQHPRFKQLNQRAKEAEARLAEIQKQTEEAENAKLKEQEKYKELAEKSEAKLAEIESNLKAERLESAITLASKEAGIVDNDVALKLIDQSKVEYDDNGRPSNINELVSKLAEEKPYLVSSQAKAQPNVGSNVNPETTTGDTKVWKLSELRKQMSDYEWYTEHKAEVDAVFREGRVKNDE